MVKGDFPVTSFLNVYPKPSATEAPEHTPDLIASYYKTALRNLRGKGNADYSAAGLMARKALEVAVNLHNAAGKNLKAKIQDLHAKHVITDSLAEWAHEIRAIGNEAAHEDDLLSKEDAKQIVYFSEMLFTYLFTLPGMLADRRK